MERRFRQRFQRVTILVMLAWTAGIAISLAWEFHLLNQQAREMARFEAEGAFKRDLVYRAWNAALGGVYAPADRIEPNPYLKVENRDLDTEIGRLTMVNPSYMTRIVHGIAAERTGIVSHITSLDPIRPANAPSPWEREALMTFETGAQEYQALTHTHDGTQVLRYMRPLVVEHACLTCHEIQGYRLGDIRGGISVTVPMEPVLAIQGPTRTFSVVGHVGIWMLGLMGIGVGGTAMSRLFGRLEDTRQQALADRARAEEADQAKSRFLATMSHELRTPLNAILGFSQMIEQRVFGPTGHPNYEEYAHDIRTSGEHLLALINDVLDLSRIEAGRLDLADERVALGPLIADVIAVMRPQAERQSIRLDVDVQPRMPDMRADSRAVRQMLLNLIANALRFTASGGRILVTANINLEGQAMLAITDTGSGIPDAEQALVLEPFRQGSRVAAKGKGGTGLGLPLVKGLIERHGGHLELISREGVGTTIKLYFPRNRLLPKEV